MKVVSRGAEATVFLSDNDTIIKKRDAKAYRHPEIDSELRRSRTKREAKILGMVPVPAPKVLSVKTDSIEMEHIPGQKLSDCLEDLDYKRICQEIGKKISLMHGKGIIHGDLTTSNMIFSDEVYFIDFGLSFISAKAEDKAVDLHLLRQALESRHYTIFEDCFLQVKDAYQDKDVLKRLEQVELRGRHKAKQ